MERRREVKTQQESVNGPSLRDIFVRPKHITSAEQIRRLIRLRLASAPRPGEQMNLRDSQEQTASRINKRKSWWTWEYLGLQSAYSAAHRLLVLLVYLCEQATQTVFKRYFYRCTLSLMNFYQHVNNMQLNGSDIWICPFTRSQSKHGRETTTFTVYRFII